MSCPRCLAPGYECHKNGLNATGTQRYYCRLCQRNFTPQVREARRKKQELARELANVSGVSAREVARRLGVHHQTVVRWVEQAQRQRCG